MRRGKIPKQYMPLEFPNERRLENMKRSAAIRQDEMFIAKKDQQRAAKREAEQDLRARVLNRKAWIAKHAAFRSWKVK